MLLASVTVNNSTFYGSLKGHAGEKFYSPWVKRMPTLELGPVEDSGRIGVMFGNLVIVNDHLNEENPFSLEAYEDLVNNPQLYDCTLKWGEDGENLFDGQLFLQGLTESEITFALTDKEFSLGARPFTLTESFVFVEGVNYTSAGTLLEITANSHNLTVGTLISFEKMSSYGQSLQYTGVTSDNYYYVNSVTSVDSFTLLDKNFVPVGGNVGTTGTFITDNENHRVGVPLRVPFSWGVVREQTPVIKKNDVEVANPSLQLNSTSAPITIREDGVLVYTTDVNSTEYWGASGNSGVAPTSDVIRLNRQTTGGVLSVSGISNRSGSTSTSQNLGQFFSYVATQLGLTIDINLI